MKDKEYCIFNKQYTKQERETLVPQIIEKMQKEEQRWLFFDPAISSSPFNDTVAYDYYPVETLIKANGEKITLNEHGQWSITLSNDDSFVSDALLDLWWKQTIQTKRRNHSHDVNIPAWIETIEANKLANPFDVQDDILEKAILCSETGRPFRIVQPELFLYRKLWLPLPRKHPDIRHQERISQRPGRTLHLRQCDKCHEQMLSVYPPDYDGKVYCEDDYKQEVFG